MAVAVALALASLALGAGGLRLDAGLHLDGRGRIVSPRDGPDERTLEAVAIPSVRLGWSLPDAQLDASYAPRLRAPDLLSRSDVVVVHAAELRTMVRPHPAWQLSLLARGERGTTDLLTESHQAGAEFQTITTTAQLRYQAARGEVGLTGRIDPRTALTLSAGVFVDGGDGPRAEALNPLERGVRAEAGLAWTASRLDRLGVRLTTLGTRLDRGPTSAVATLEGGWRRRLTRTFDGWIGGGITGAYEDPRDGPTTREALPAAEVGVGYTPPAPQPTTGEEGAPTRETPAPLISSQAVVRYSPTIDRATGAIDPQVEGTLRAQWRVTPRWAFGANVVGAIVRQSGSDSKRGRLEAQATWAASTWAHLGAGVYGSVQRSSTPALPSFDEYGAYLSIELVAPTVRP